MQARVSGMGGIGKTTLAVEAAHRLAVGKQFEGVWYVPAADPNSIRASLATLARKLDKELGERDATAETALALLAKRTQPWLLVYDNATLDAVNRLLPTEGPVRVLITSRQTNWPAHFATVDLAKMKPAQAQALLRNALPDMRAYPDADLARLAKRLDFWPLGLVAAAGYLQPFHRPPSPATCRNSTRGRPKSATSNGRCTTTRARRASPPRSTCRSTG